MENKPKFKFEKLKDSYDTILAKGKSKYQEDIKTMLQLECTAEDFWDLEAKVLRTKGERWLANKLRAEHLKGLDLVKIL